MGENFDRARADAKKRLASSSKVRKHTAFIGPIPLDWLTQASKLPGKTLAIAIALSWRRHLEKSPTIRLTASLAARFGVSSRNGRYHALEYLEAAGLVTVERFKHQAPLVKIVLPGESEA